MRDSSINVEVPHTYLPLAGMAELADAADSKSYNGTPGTPANTGLFRGLAFLGACEL